MFNKPNILVCSDFSEHSNQAVEAAIELAKRLNGKIYALHVVDIPAISNYPADLSPVSFEIPQELLDSCHQSLSGQFAKLRSECKILVRIGDAYAIIQNTISENNIELVVLGARGNGERVLPFGSISTKLVSTAKVPVLVIKKPFTANRMTVLADPEANLKNLLSSSEELSFLLSSKLGVVSLYDTYRTKHVSEGSLAIPLKTMSMSDEKREEVEQLIRKRIEKCLTKYSSAEIEIVSAFEKKLSPQLNLILQSNHTDLAIMRRHEEVILERFLLGSETRRMLEVFEGNILVLPPC